MKTRLPDSKLQSLWACRNLTLHLGSLHLTELPKSARRISASKDCMLRHVPQRVALSSCEMVSTSQADSMGASNTFRLRISDYGLKLPHPFADPLLFQQRGSNFLNQPTCSPLFSLLDTWQLNIRRYSMLLGVVIWTGATSETFRIQIFADVATITSTSGIAPGNDLPVMPNCGKRSTGSVNTVDIDKLCLHLKCFAFKRLQHEGPRERVA